MPRGGRRGRTPGEAYPNRSDLQTAQPISAVKDQPYGQAGQQQKAQKTAPLAGAQAARVQPAPKAPQGMGEPPLPFNRPTERKGEPITAGVPMGAGPAQPPAFFREAQG